MHDWKKLVQERLAKLNLPPGVKEDVVAELAAHLEDSAETDRATDEFQNRALAQIRWHELAHSIEQTKRMEGRMNHRTKTLWLPATGILFAAGMVLLVLDRAAILQRVIWIACMAGLIGAVSSEANRLNQRVRSLWLPAIVNLTLMGAMFLTLDSLNLNEPGIVTSGDVAKAFRTPWLLALPFLGAVGALLAKRAQASVSERLIAGLAPAWVWFATLSVLGLIFGLDRRDFVGVPLSDLALSGIGLVILPGLALLLGALPFLGDSKPVAAQD